jgi:hypothetical protein
MSNFQKTEACYAEEKYKYQKPVEQQGHELWYQKVTNPDTGTFYKISDLQIGTRKIKEDKPYPIKHANQIIRIQTADNKEWLASRQQWTAVDSQGNEITKSFNDPEVWDKPVFNYGMKPVDKKKPDGPKEHAAIELKGYKKQYDLPFNKQNLKKLYDMRPAESPKSVSLSILRKGYDDITIEHPFQIVSYEDFANKPFDELWDYMSTPKYRLDRSYKDNLEASHIR